jgi:hypothetical protein
MMMTLMTMIVMMTAKATVILHAVRGKATVWISRLLWLHWNPSKTTVDGSGNYNSNHQYPSPTATTTIKQ